MLLLEDKYSHIECLISDLGAALLSMDDSFAPSTEHLQHMLEVFAHPGRYLQIITDRILNTFSRLLGELHYRIALMQEEYVIIDVAGSQDSLLKSGGDLNLRRSTS
jgi:hypothetical protein